MRKLAGVQPESRDAVLHARRRFCGNIDVVSALDTKDSVKDAYVAFMNGDMSTLSKFLSADCVLHQSGVPGTVTGTYDICLTAAQTAAAARIYRVQDSCVVAEGPVVAIRLRRIAVIDGEEVAFDTMTFMRLQDDKIAEIWNVQGEALSSASSEA